MRAIILAVLVAVGIGLAGTPTVSAAPINGAAIGENATQDNVAKAHWRGPSRRWRGGGCHRRHWSSWRC